MTILEFRNTARLGLTAAAIVAFSGAALADRIDGDWCDGARNFTINGPSIRTPGGNTIEGHYGRHDFRYSIPVGEPGAGATVDMRLLNDDNAQVKYGAEEMKVWRRCKVTS